MFEGKVFYSKENGQMFECFANKEMEEINPDIVEDLFFHNRKERVNYMKIAERQVEILQNSLADKSYEKFSLLPESTIELYHFYSILSDEEYQSIINHRFKD